MTCRAHDGGALPQEECSLSPEQTRSPQCNQDVYLPNRDTDKFSVFSVKCITNRCFFQILFPISSFWRSVLRTNFKNLGLSWFHYHNCFTLRHISRLPFDLSTPAVCSRSVKSSFSTGATPSADRIENTAPHLCRCDGARPARTKS